MTFGIVIVVIVLIAFLMGSDTGKYVLAAGVSALACLIVYEITGLGIMVALAKLCGVVAILIAAVAVISAILGR